MRTRFGKTATALGVLALGATVAACGSSSTSGTSGGSGGGTGTSTGSGTGFQLLSPNNTGTPQKGGVLNLVGTGDVDFMDPNLNYYTVGYAAAREYSRQLYTYPAQMGKVTSVVPDLATGMPKISNGGKTYTVTIKSGAKWDTTPARQVTGADEVRGVEITCNPAQPFGGTPDFEGLIVGMTKFCSGFSKVSATSPSAIAAYLKSHSISGVTASGNTVTFKLTNPATYFTDELALPALSPRPAELLKYLPGSAQEAQNTISDGPYKIASYNPTHTIDFVRNPAWDSSTDTVRKAYVNEIKITETGQQDSNQQQLQTNTPTADLSWDLGPNPIVANQLITQNNKNLNVQSEIASNPYVIFNTQSPNNNGALSKVAVRQAISYAINRNDLIQDAGGPKLAPALTHVLPPQMLSSTSSDPANKDFYPYNPTKAKSMLAQAGVKNLTLKFLYRPASDTSKKMFETLQGDLAKAGIKLTGVAVPEADFYVKYLEVPSTAKQGVWDLSLAGWGPDWYQNGALTFFKPLFDGRILPPSSSNFGLFNDPKVNSLIDQASTAASSTQANNLWNQADAQVMKDAAIFPIEDPNTALYHSDQAHNCIYIPALQNFDFTNVWLDPSKNGG